MGFHDLLAKRLGPLAELATSKRAQALRPSASDLWLRRGLGVEVQATLGAHGARLQGPHDGPELTLNDHDLEVWSRLTRWTRGCEIPVSSSTLERWLNADLLYWSEVELSHALPEIAPAGPRARLRRGVWATPAVETAIKIAPPPFMPRERDLDGARLVGARFAELARGHEVGGHTLLGSAEDADRLHRILGALGRTDPKTGKDRSEARRIEALLAQLDRLGLLEPQPESLPHLESRLTWLGHATVLLEHAGANILVDPLFHAGSVPPEATPARPSPAELPELDAVLITHGDNDHLSPNALLQLPPETPIYLPRVTAPPPAHQVDMEGLLRTLGFHDLRSMSPYETFEIGPYHVTALPFDGEDWGLEQAQLTYRIECSAYAAFFAADSLGPPETYRYLAEHPVDIAFMGVSGAAEPLVGPPGLGYGNFYQRWIPPAHRGRFVVHTAGPEESAEFVRSCNPNFAVPYAAGAPWMSTEYADHGSHAAFAETLSDAPTEVLLPEVGVPIPAGQIRRR